MRRIYLLAIAIVLVGSCAVRNADAYYAAHMGRFASRDPYGQIGRMGTEVSPNFQSGGVFLGRDRFDPTADYHDGMNLYEYGQSRPLNALDPSGLYMTGVPGYPYPGYPGPPIDPTKVPPGPGPHPIGPPAWPGCIKKVIDKTTPTFGPNDSDKYKHCVMSCQIKRDCGTASSIIAGIGKEIIDAVGPGDADWGDIIADKDGWLCKDKPSCEDQCRKKYP